MITALSKQSKNRKIRYKNMKISTFFNKFIFSLLILLNFGVGNVLALDEYKTVTDFNNSSTFNSFSSNEISNSVYSKTANHVTFKINDVSYLTGMLSYGTQNANKTVNSQFSWAPENSNYTVSVTGVSIQLKGYQAKISPKSATGQFTDGTTTGTSVECKTNSVSGGAKTVSISASPVKTPLTLQKKTGGNSAIYSITSVTYTYKVTHKEYLFGFSASAIPNNTSYGTASATVEDETVQAAIGVKSATTKATFTATPKTGCQFLGWYDNSSFSGNPISTEATYEKELSNTTAGSTTSLTLYAKFDNKLNQTITWDQTVTGAIRGNVITLTATASSGLEVSYTAVPSGRVSISGNTLTCLTAGPVTITANQAGNDNYHPSSNTPSITFTIAEHAITKNPTATGITYEQTLSNSILSGGTANVPGSWSWKYPNSIPNAGTANQIAVFTPSSTVISGEPLECYVSVTVAKALPDVTCNIESNYMVDAQELNLAALWTREGDGAITYSRTFTPSGSNNGGATTPTISVDNHIGLGQAGALHLTMEIAEGTNYLQRTVTKDLTIHKYNSIYASAATLNVNVDANVTSAYTLTYTKPNNSYVGAANLSSQTPVLGESTTEPYYVLDQHVTTTHTEGSDAPEKAITYNAGNKTATGKNQGYCDIILTQPETYKYNYATATFRVNVSKLPNTFSYTWRGSAGTSWKETMHFEENAAFVYTTNNNLTSPEIEQTKGNDEGNVIATYSTTTKNITSSYNKGQAVWSLHQDENYKYVEANAKCTVTVKEKDCPTCYAYKYDPDNTVTKIGEVGWGVDSVANVLTLNMKPNGTAAGDDALLSYWIVDEWVQNEIKAPFSALLPSNFYYKPIDPIQLDPHTTRLKFERGGDILSTGVGTAHTDDPYVNTIRVSRLAWLELNSTTGKALDTLFIYKEIGEANKKGTFQLKISTCDAVVKLASNDSKVTLSESSINLTTGDTYDGGYLSQNITVTYTCDHKDTTDAIISAYTQYEHKTFVVRAITKANTQEIVWKAGYEGDVVSLPVNSDVSISDAASASSGLIPVLYSTNKPDVIEISADRQSFKVISTEQATLTASQAGNDEYEPVEDTKIIQGTEKIIQNIIWEKNYTRSMVLGTTTQMEAVVDTVNTITGESEYSEARTHKLVYSCPENNKVIEIIDSCYIHVIGEGTTTVTAYVEGDDRYEAASYTKRVFVRQSSNGCESHYVYVQKANEQILFFLFDAHMYELTKTVTFSPDSGVPDKLNFSVRGVPYHKIGRDFFAGNIDFYQSKDNGATWEKLGTVEPVQDSTVNSGDIQLDSQTTMIKFVRPQWGQGYHYIEDLVVTRRQILEPDNAIIDLGDVPAGSIRTDDISFYYSEMKGDLSITKGNGDETYNKLELDEESIGIECGSFGSYDLGFKFKPTKVGPWSQTVTVADPLSSKTFTATITANVIKGTQSIEWDPDPTTFYTVQGDEFNAQLPKTSNRGLDVQLSTTATDVVTFSGTTATIHKHSNGEQISITAACPGNTNYHDAEQVTKTFTFNITPTTIMILPGIPTIYGGTNAGDVVLNAAYAVTEDNIKHTSVPGTYMITTPNILNEGPQDIMITFIPEDDGMFLPCSVMVHNVEIQPSLPLSVDHEFLGSVDNKWEIADNWKSGSVPGEGEDVLIAGNVTLATTASVGSLTIKENYTVTVGDGGVLTINGTSSELSSYGDLHILDGGRVNVGSGTFKVRDFILDAALGNEVKSSKSGQLRDEDKNMQVMRDAYFQMAFDPTGQVSFGYYDFVVPFEINIADGIIRKGCEAPLADGVDFRVLEYSEANQAAGVYSWPDVHGTMIPGRAYSITLDNRVTQNQILFKFNKREGATLGGPDTFHAQASSGENAKRGWNGLGNSTLQHKELQGLPEGKKIQWYKHSDNIFVPCLAQEWTFAVGTSFFMQVTAPQDITLSPATSGRKFLAPALEGRIVDEFKLSLSNADNEEIVDRMWFSASEDADDTYVIEHDLLKMGTPTDAKVAQMWITKGGKRLCDAEVTLYNNEAQAPLSLFTPNAGQFLLSVEAAPKDATLYLTKNGNIIWNLSDAPYLFDLSKGTTEEYGLRMSANRAPQSINEADGNAKSVRKVLINDQMYIITSDGAMYGVIGKKIQ